MMTPKNDLQSDLNLEDIARLSGFSRSTVSRVVNHHPNVSEKTRRMVMEVIEKYNFQPNPAARALASQRYKVIAIVIPNIVSDVFTDPFFSILLQSITTCANLLDYSVTLWLTSAEVDENAFYDRVIGNRLYDGMIVASAAVDHPFVERLQSQGKPYFLVGRPLVDEALVNFVDVENVAGARLAVEHLIHKGHRRIGMLPGRQALASSQDRQQGYFTALQQAGLPVDLRLVAPSGNYTEASGYQGMHYLLKQGVDAVFAANDAIATGALRAIKEAGLRVPVDIAVVGFDDIPLASMTEPPLTTVRQPISQLGTRSVEKLVELLEGKCKPPCQQLLPVELIVRGST
jgi:LacI family transcriptional regulator